ncbi:MAG: hypothetical protein AAB614_01320 [Patescibacteria group bacterium]
MNQLANIINISGLSWDILAFCFLIFVSLLYGMLLGKNRIILTILSTYISFAILSVFPLFYLQSFFVDRIFFLKLSLFLIFMVLSFIFLNRSFFGKLFKVSKALYNTSFLKITLLSFAQIGLFMSILFTMVVSEKVAKITNLTELIFVSQTAQVIWFIIPLVLLGFFKNRSAE